MDDGIFGAIKELTTLGGLIGGLGRKYLRSMCLVHKNGPRPLTQSLLDFVFDPFTCKTFNFGHPFIQN